MKGKSGGERAITYNVFATGHDGTVYLVSLYDKEETSTVKLNVVEAIPKGLGLLKEQALQNLPTPSVKPLNHGERLMQTGRKSKWISLAY